MPDDLLQQAVDIIFSEIELYKCFRKDKYKMLLSADKENLNAQKNLTCWYEESFFIESNYNLKSIFVRNIKIVSHYFNCFKVNIW